MSITFTEIVQEVINEVRAREEVMFKLKDALERIKVLEAELNDSKNVREPDKQNPIKKD